MKIIGLTRVRNEEDIICDTLDHMATFCDMIFVYDNASTDNTVTICKDHRAAPVIIEGQLWGADRARAEWQNRAELLRIAKHSAKPQDWFVYMDADERIEFDWRALKLVDENVIGVKMKLFDFYITPFDVDKHYSERQYCGPEYREIIMAFRNLPTLDYSSPDQREVHLRQKGEILHEGFVKHYGKGISIKQWEDTCEYYVNYFPKYSEKWKKRKGKAVHTTSSFGMPLIKWDEKEIKGILLTKEIERHSIYN